MLDEHGQRMSKCNAYVSTLDYLINEQDGIGKQGGNFLNHKNK